jgi:hypothetical protein
MPIQLPQFSHRHLTYLSLCAIFPAEDKPLANLIPSGKAAELESSYGLNGPDTFVHLVTNRFSDGSFHLHVDVAAESFFEGDSPTSLSNIEVLLDRLSQFVNHTAKLIMLEGHVTVEIEKLPKRGLARGLKGIEAEVGGETLELVGATFSISGKPFDRLKWRMKGDESIAASIFASLQNEEITDCYLENGVRIMFEGIDKFLTEKQHENRLF